MPQPWELGLYEKPGQRSLEMSCKHRHRPLTTPFPPEVCGDGAWGCWAGPCRALCPTTPHVPTHGSRAEEELGLSVAPGARTAPSLGGASSSEPLLLSTLCTPRAVLPPARSSRAELRPSARFGSGCTRGAPGSSPLTGRGDLANEPPRAREEKTGGKPPSTSFPGCSERARSTRSRHRPCHRPSPKPPGTGLARGRVAVAQPGGHRAALPRSHAAGQSPSGSAAPPAAGLGLRLRLAELGGSRRSVGAACRGRAPARGLPSPAAAPACKARQPRSGHPLVSHLGNPWGQREGDPGGWGWWLGAWEPGCGMPEDLGGRLQPVKLCAGFVLSHALRGPTKQSNKRGSSRRACLGMCSVQGVPIDFPSVTVSPRTTRGRTVSSSTATSLHRPGTVTRGPCRSSSPAPSQRGGSGGAVSPSTSICPRAHRCAASFGLSLSHPIPCPAGEAWGSPPVRHSPGHVG